MRQKRLKKEWISPYAQLKFYVGFRLESLRLQRRDKILSASTAVVRVDRMKTSVNDVISVSSLTFSLIKQ